MPILIVFYSGLRGKRFKAPRLRAVIDALRAKGFHPIVYGIPDTKEMFQWLGVRGSIQVWGASVLSRLAQKLGILRAKDRDVCRDAIERLAIERLRRGDIKIAYVQHTFGRLIEHGAGANIRIVAELPIQETHKGPAKSADPVLLASRVVVFCDADKIELVRRGGQADRIESIYPVDAGVYPATPEARCPDVQRFIYTSFFNKRKRLDMVLRAWAGRTVQVGELHVVGPLEGALKRLISDYRARSDVRFWGLQDPREFYVKMQGVGIQASKREGLPRAMLEYMQHGFPVLVSAEASKGFVRDGVEGKVLDPCNDETLGEAFDVILSDYEAFWTCGRAGRERLQRAIANGGFGRQVADVVIGLAASAH